MIRPSSSAMTCLSEDRPSGVGMLRSWLVIAIRLHSFLCLFITCRQAQIRALISSSDRLDCCRTALSVVTPLVLSSLVKNVATVLFSLVVSSRFSVLLKQWAFHQQRIAAASELVYTFACLVACPTAPGFSFLLFKSESAIL